VDACKAGWLGVIATGEHMGACFASTLDDLVAAADKDGPVALIALDMPIGLPDHEHREADVLARNVVGRLRNSVFITPVRAAFAAPDHATASARNRELTVSGISIQAFSLQSKVLEVDAWIHRTRRWVVEIHPEVSFATLAGAALTVGKKTWAGTERRRELLATAGVLPRGDLGEAGRMAAVDDILDAAVAAWTAQQVLRGVAQPHPNPPQVFSDGLPCAIWH
jgi:predicted RNase H-like nuclease